MPPGYAKPLAHAVWRRELALPPPFTLVTLREVGDAFAHAVSIAAEQGAGTLVYVGRFDLAEFAVVLEPDEPLRTARRAFYAGMAALADALLAYAPPEKPITIDWPDAIRVDGGLVGGGRLAWPEGAREDEPPPWLVFGAMIRTVSMTETEPGLHPLARRAGGGGLRRCRLGSTGREFCAPSHGAHRCLEGTRVWRGGAGISPAAAAREGRAPRHRRQRRSADRAVSARPETERQKLVAGAGDAVVARSEDRGAAVVKLLRTIRLDPSDTFVFERAAEPGEWAVSGAFAFWNDDVTALEGKARAAFRSGFLGVQSLGWSTLVQIVEASDAGSRGGGRSAGATAGRTFWRARSRRRRAPRRKRKSRLRRRCAISRQIR